MLLQSQDGNIRFLPALPDTWAEGSFGGLCVRGGGVADAKWEEGKLSEAVLTANVDNEFKIEMPQASHYQVYIDNKLYDGSTENGILKLRLKAGQIAKIEFR
jgi:alpha-L-fucosidase 2